MNKIKKNNIIKIGNYKYLVYKISKKKVELLPIDVVLSGESTHNFIPKIVFKNDLNNSYEEVDEIELLFLLNERNPLIKEVLNNYFESKES